MAKFKIYETPLQGLVIVEPTIYRDNRGFFLEFWNQGDFRAIGITTKFVQDNHSRSIKGVIRGLHFQDPLPQSKLVRVVGGIIFDVGVDLRKDSPTFGKWFGTVLSDENFRMLFIPEGFAHGFLVLSDSADVLYKVSEPFIPEYDKGILWSDETIGIEWPIKEFGIDSVIVSDKDKNLPILKDFLQNK